MLLYYPYTDITNNIQTAVAAEIPSDDLSADMESSVQLSSSDTPSPPVTTVSSYLAISITCNYIVVIMIHNHACRNMSFKIP